MNATTLVFEELLPEEPIAIDLTQLYTRFHTLPDHRDRRGVRYPLPLLLTVAVLAKLTGHTQVRDGRVGRVTGGGTRTPLSISARHQCHIG